MSRDAAIGKYLAGLREKAGYKQNELARKLGWSPAVLSRSEAGERPLSDEERTELLAAIGTPEAAAFATRLSREWKIIPEPTFDEPDADLIWEAEQAAQRVSTIAAQPDVKHFFERRLERYSQELLASAARLTQKTYRVVFSGAIAAGKSTVICRVEGLEIPGDKAMPLPVLEAGGGGVTICEVHVRRGPQFGVLIEPCSEEEVRRHVLDFARTLLDPASSAAEMDGSEAANSSPGISREIDRALRNMAKLPPPRRAARNPDGSRAQSVDQGRALAESIGELKALAVEILARMELHRRDRRVIWHDASAEKPPLVWLQETFRLVNNGLHPEFSLPRRIEVVVPHAPLGQDSLSITLIDTQGIDDVAGRADLEQHFDDAHSIVVLCSRFEEAPSVHIRHLLSRAREAGVRTLSSHTAILVLPRPGDAMQMTDNGVPVQSVEEGYDVKGDQVRLMLHGLGLSNLPVLFFNAAEQDREELRAFLLSRIDDVRAHHRAAMRDVVSGANAMLANYEKEQAQEAIRLAARPLATWLKNNAELKEEPSRHVQDSLLSATRTAYPRTIHAAVVREGNWPKLSYGHHLSHGARRMAAQVTESKLHDFRAIATNVLQQDALAEGHDLVAQAVRALEDGFDGLMRKVQLVGQSVYADELSDDDEFWRECEREWGRGSGYRDRVNRRNDGWFKMNGGKAADTRVKAIIHQEWKNAVESVVQLMPSP
jgi:transcriptional regulator with XRE-family HTH domain